MTGLPKRIENVAGALDRGVASLFGARWFQTVSGTVGRACGEAGHPRESWGPPARAAIELQPWFGRGHCKRWADKERVMEDLLTQAGLAD